MSIGVPSRMAISRVCTTFLAESLALTVLICIFACESLRKRLACPCGSIMSGQRLVIDMMMPFSTLNASAGRPSIFHWRTLTGSAKILLSEQSAVYRMPTFLSCASHSLVSEAR